MSSFTGYAIVVVVVFIILCQYSSQKSTSQPKFVAEKIPFISHAIGIAQEGALYYKRIRDTTGLSIFGLRILTQRFYVITDLSLITKVQRHPSISFDPLILLAAERLCGASKSMLQTMRNETKDGKKTRSSLMHESHVLTHAMLRSQPDLSSMVGSMLEVVSSELTDVRTRDLYSWIRRTVCLASTDALYGPRNPFRLDPELDSAFWEYDADLSLLLLNILPSVTARKGYRARSALRLAFTNYFRTGGPQEASEFVRAVNDANIKRGISEEDRAGFEVAHCIGLLVNTPPTLFWTLFHIFSNPGLLKQLRLELSQNLAVKSEGDLPAGAIDTEKIMKGCPLLHSTFNEVLRIHASSLSTRVVLEDTSIGSDILLKKGGIVHMPSKCLHSDERYFGPNVDTFDPTRFLNGISSKSQAAFRPFGGGSTLCPGRHFATMQILSITALVLQSFDLIPETGKWIFPRILQSTMTTTVLPPVDAIRVRFQPRTKVVER